MLQITKEELDIEQTLKQRLDFICNHEKDEYTQKYIIKYTVYTSEDKVIKKLLLT